LPTIDAIDRELLEPLAKRTAEIEREISGLEQAAVLGMTPANGGYVRKQEKERTTEDLLRERELRDRLHQMDPTTRRELYLRAVEDGTDPELVAAVDRAHKAFPLVDQATLSMTREWRIEQSPLAPRRRELQLLHEAYGLLLEGAQIQLDDMRKAIDPASVEAAQKRRSSLVTRDA
jgi:hypothetical protein